MNDSIARYFDPSLDPQEQIERAAALGIRPDELDPVAEEMESLGLPATVDTDVYLRARHMVVTGRLPAVRLVQTTLRFQRELDRRNLMIGRLLEDAEWILSPAADEGMTSGTTERDL